MNMDCNRDNEIKNEEQLIEKNDIDNYEDYENNIDIGSEEETTIEDDGSKKVIKTVSLITVLLLFAVFIIILSFTGIIGKYLGKVAEDILLGIIALILLFVLYKNDRSNKNDKEKDTEK